MLGRRPRPVETATHTTLRALVSISGEMSAPTTMPSVPTSGSAIRAASPVPVETSRTRHFGPTPAAASTAGINSLDHRPVHRSYAVASTVLPGAAWKPAPNVVLIAVAPITSVEACASGRSIRWDHSTLRRVEVPAFRDFDAVYDRCGSFASMTLKGGDPPKSAMSC